MIPLVDNYSLRVLEHTIKDDSMRSANMEVDDGGWFASFLFDSVTETLDRPGAPRFWRLPDRTPGTLLSLYARPL